MMTTDRGDRIPNSLYGPAEDEETYFDRKPFRDYCKEISDLIHAADHALTIGDIHRLLGDRAQVRWTADALESIKGIEEVAILPARYRPKGRPDIPIVQSPKELLSQLFTKY